MFSFQLNNSAKKLLHEIEELKQLTDTVAALSQQFDPVFPWVVSIAECGPQNTQSIQVVQSLYIHFNHVSGITSAVSPNQFFRSLHKLENILESFLSANLSIKDIMDDLLFKIRDFTDAYDNYLNSSSGKNAALLVKESYLLNILIVNLNNILNLIANNFEEILPGEIHYGEISLLLPTSFSLNDFAERLLAINRLYSELCKVLSVSELENPIKISKIESGSLWAQFLGNPEVIGLMIICITNSIDFFHRTFTKEGKITNIPKQIDALNATLKITENMKKLGLNTEEMERFNERSGLEIAKNLNIILAKQQNITLNGKLLAVGKDSEMYYLEAAKSPYLLQESNTTDENLSSEQNHEDENESI
jgi:hypothetical protein